MFRSLEGGLPLFRSHVIAVAKGEMAPLLALEKLKLFGVTTKVTQRIFLRQAVHENVLAMKVRGISPNAEEQLRAASREIDMAFEHLNKDDFPGNDPSLILMNWH